MMIFARLLFLKAVICAKKLLSSLTDRALLKTPLGISGLIAKRARTE